MIISDLKIYPITIPLRTPFIISAGTQNEYHGVLLQLTTDDGTIGWGEAAPSERVTGESVASVMRALEDVAKPLILGSSVDDSEIILKSVEGALANQPSACCAVDIALHDLKGKKAKMPIKHLIGGYRQEMPISYTVVVGNVEDTLKNAQANLAEGAKILKIKIGTNPAEDVERIKALRDKLGNDIVLTADANEGYSVDDAISTLNKIHRYELSFVEQPVSATDIDGLQKVHSSVEVPIMADEAARSVSDVLKLIKADAVDMFNIKLMKCGGLRNAVKISNLAEAAGMACQIGCMIETGIAISAGTHLALALENVKFADLDGHTFLKHNVVQEYQITRDGVNSISGRPGLGVGVDYSFNYFIDGE